MPRAGRSAPARRPEVRVSEANARVLARFDEHLATRPLRTREAYRRDVAMLAVLAGERPIVDLKRAELARHLATLHGRGLSGRSLARTLSAWRALYRHLLDRERGLAEDPTAGLKPPKSPRRLPSALSPDEASQLVEIVADDPLSLRDRAILELAYSSGLRLSELAGLDLARIDFASGEARVTGKGAKERIVPVGSAAIEALKRWLPARAALAPRDEPAAFVARTGARLSPRSIEQRLAAWAVKQGLGRHVHPHMLRHSFASHVLQSSGDLRAVQEMLGHASIASTQVYTHLDFQALAKVYDAAHPRAKKRGARKR
jgi:integrase/recombinase XerC